MSYTHGTPEPIQAPLSPQPSHAREAGPVAGLAAANPGDGDNPLAAPTDTPHLAATQQAGTWVEPGTRRRRSVAVPLLASLLVLVVLTAGAVTALFLTRNSDYTRARRTIAVRDSALRADQQQIQQLSDDLRATRDDLDKTKQNLQGAQNQTDELKHEKQVITDCLNLLAEASDAQQSGDRAGAQAKLKQAKPMCAEAQRYLGT